jgi:hypothetical protein
MNGTNEGPAPVEPSSNSLESLTSDQLAELGANPEMLASVRAEVVRRLKDDPRKANFLTFRWFMPANDADKADAFDGLIAVCWKATKKRLPHGLFPRGYPETYCGKRERRDGSIAQPAGGVAEETREAIIDALVDCLYDLRSLSVPEVILKALNSGFHTDADVGNAVRRKVWKESKYLFKNGDDVVSNHDEDNSITLFEVLPEESDGTNHYSDAVELILEEKSQVVEALGEEGWEVLEEIVELVDNDLLPPTKRERERVLTEVFQKAYGVNERQASTHKRRFQEAFETAAADGKPVFDELLDLLGCWD